MTANEKINEVLEKLIKITELQLEFAEKSIKDPKMKDLAGYYKGEAYAYEFMYGVLQDYLIDDDNL